MDCGAYSADDLYPIGVEDCALNDWTLNTMTGLWEATQNDNWGSAYNGVAQVGRNLLERFSGPSDWNR